MIAVENMPPWSLTTEICARAGVDDLSAAVRKLGLLEQSERLELAVKSSGWYRGGAETYLFDFELRSESGTRRFLLKACVAVGGLRGTAEIVEEWVRRRAFLEHEGVAVPRSYGVHLSTILEEFIPLALREALVAAEGAPTARQSLLFELGRAAGILTRCGFPALQLNDLRSRGTDVVVVDFGEDLGPAGAAGRDHTAILDQALTLAGESVSLVAGDMRTLDAGFEAGRRAGK